MKGKVVGIGGIFFKGQKNSELKDWYGEKLGLPVNDHGAMFSSLDSQTKENLFLQWSIFEENTDYFEPSKKEFMINYRVENLEGLLEDLKEKGVTILDEITTYPYGKFLHILDPKGNKVELWEPDNSFQG